MKLVSISITGIFLLAAAGCTHVQLRNDAVNESAAVGELETQEVMNNLAMFVYDPHSMPFFSYPNQGATSVQDQASAGASAGWGRSITSGETAPTFSPKHFGDFLLNSLGLTSAASRSIQDGLTMTPILDPRKLELMRCAYQLAVSNCAGDQLSKACPDCQARFNNFYTGDPNGKIGEKSNGIVTSNCLKGPCWFHVGTKKCLPKDCCCINVGQYCGVYVWVDHDGRDELTRLTLAILDYAIHEPPVLLTKVVSYNIDELGLPTSKNDAVGTVTATVGITERNESLLNIPEANAVQIEQVLQGRRKMLQDRLAMKPAPSDAEAKEIVTEMGYIDQKLEFLKQQLQAGGLKEQYAPGGAPPAPNGLLQLQLYQNNLQQQPTQ